MSCEKCNCQKSDCANGSCSSSNYITIDFEDAKIKCPVLATFEINEQLYIVLHQPDMNKHLLYRYTDSKEGIQLDVIEGEEFDLVAKTYKAIANIQ